jgi:hypothetical protein
MARQREGDISTFNFIDNLSRAIKHAGRILVDMIPHVYTGERIIRVIHEDGTNKSVPINQPFNPQQQAEQDEDAAQDQQAVLKVYDLTTGKYDITCEVGPSYTTKRQEAAEAMTEFIRAFPAAAPMIGDLLAKNQDWPGADEIAKRLKAMLPPQIQGQNPQVMQMQQQMQQMDAHAKQAVGQLQQQLGALQQQLQASQSKEQAAALDKQIEFKKTQIDFYNAVTNRMKAVQTLADAQMVEAKAMQEIGMEAI